MLISSRIVGLLALILIAFMNGCKTSSRTAHDKGLVLSTDMPLRSYVKSAVGANGRRQTRLYFPLLQIYDASGALVYVSHDANANAEILRTLPESIADRQPLPDTATLMQVVKNTPGFQAKEEAFKKARQATALSVVLEDCHACSIQEEALDGTQRELLDRGVMLLMVHVDKPTSGQQ